MAGKKRYGRNAKKRRRIKIIIYVVFMAVLILLSFGLRNLIVKNKEARIVGKMQGVEVPDFVEPAILDEKANSRSGKQLEAVRGIVVHYVANPGTSAMQNRDYFAGEETVVNAHFVVGLEGEIVQCIPLNEQSVASNWRNADTISIEVCHPDETGQFNEKTMDALTRLTVWLLQECKLKPEDVIRHYDVTGKMCPLYYVEHPDAWEAFIDSLGEAMKG